MPPPPRFCPFTSLLESIWLNGDIMKYTLSCSNFYFLTDSYWALIGQNALTIASILCRERKMGILTNTGLIWVCKKIKIAAPPNEWRNIPLSWWQSIQCLPIPPDSLSIDGIWNFCNSDFSDWMFSKFLSGLVLAVPRLKKFQYFGFNFKKFDDR